MCRVSVFLLYFLNGYRYRVGVEDIDLELYSIHLWVWSDRLNSIRIWAVIRRSKHQYQFIGSINIIIIISHEVMTHDYNYYCVCGTEQAKASANHSTDIDLNRWISSVRLTRNDLHVGWKCDTDVLWREKNDHVVLKTIYFSTRMASYTSRITMPHLYVYFNS